MRGPSGSGKSDLALRLIDAGARLIADDRCDLTLENEGITVSPPEKLAGLLEVRGVGVIELPHVAVARLGLVVDLVGRGHMQRLPAQKQCSFLGVEVPLIALTPFEPSAPSKIRLLARRLARIPTALS